MESLIIIITLAFYISLSLELTIWNVPSVVSSTKLLRADEEQIQILGPTSQRMVRWPRLKKILVLFAPLVLIYILYTLPILNLFGITFSDWFLFKPNLTLISIGLIFVVLGRFASHWYLIDIRMERTTIETREDLQTMGIFAYSRNPGLIALYISFFGFFLVIPSLFFSICYIIYIVHMHFKVKLEEEFLKKMYGQSYTKYVKEVNRYL